MISGIQGKMAINHPQQNQNVGLVPFTVHSKKRSVSKEGNYEEAKKGEENKLMSESKKGKGKEIHFQDQDNGEILNTQENDGDKQKIIKINTICDILEEGESGTGGFEDGLKTKAFYARFLLIDQAVSSFSFLSITIAVVEYDLEFEEREDFVAQAMLWMTFILTLGMILLTIVRFQAKLEWLKTRKVISDKSNLISSGFMVPMIIEIIVSAVHPMPWTSNQRILFYNEPTASFAYYHLNEILLLIMLLRVLLIIRTLLMMSVWYNNRTQRVCGMYACEADYLFIIKCIMNSQPYMLVTTAMTISIFYFGFAVRICEAPLARNDEQGRLLFFSFWNCIWNIIVTMTTVGYGDYYAQTHLGRLIIFFVCIWGVLIVSMMVITLNTTLTIIPLESKAIAVLERLKRKGQMKGQAAIVLTLLAKIGFANKKDLFVGEFKRKMQIKLRKHLNQFKIAQRQYRSIGNENVSEEMGRQFDNLRDELKDLSLKQNALLETNIQLMQHLKMDQHQIEFFAKNLSRSSFQQMILAKEEKNSNYNLNAQTQQATTLGQVPLQIIIQEDANEKASENEDIFNEHKK